MSAVLLALLAALLFAVATRVQQTAARAQIAARPSVEGRTVQGRPVQCLPVARVLLPLFRNRLWVIGWGVNAVGFMIQAIALHRGSVALVQPILVTQLLFTIPVAVVGTGRRPGPVEWVAGLGVCVGIVMFVDVWGTEMLHAVDRSRVVWAVAVVWAACGALVAAGAVLRPTRRAGLEAVAAGLCFATTAVLMKMTVDPLFREGVGETLTDWPVYLLFVSTTMSLVIGQDALAAGNLPTVAAIMAITNPIASAAIGVLAFHERIPLHPSTVAGLTGAAVLVFAGVVALALSPTMRALRPGAGGRLEAVGSRLHAFTPGGFIPDSADKGDAGHVPGGTMGAMVATKQVRT